MLRMHSKCLTTSGRQTTGAPSALRLFTAWALIVSLAWTADAGAAKLASTRTDFALPGTQPLSVTDNFATPDECTTCHSNYGKPTQEPYRNWQGSMMAQSGRDPLTYAAMAIANQDANAGGESCIRCHLPKGWLEGRSSPEDGSSLTADDRQGVQCSICHRLVDPTADPENPAEDTAILAALSAPVTTVGGAQMVMDPLDRVRGPFDIVADLGSDPHLPTRSILISPYHKSSELCGTCHNVKNPLFTRDLSGDYVLNTLDEAASDPTQAFPEQSTYDEWLLSDYATTGVYAPQFGANEPMVSTCQDCHMPAITGRDASLGLIRDDLPLHSMTGPNTFIPALIPHHPVFGAEVDEEILDEGIERARALLQRSATVSADIAGGVLTVRVVNETGHKLPTGYPDGRRMWLDVRAFDANRNLVLESGRYTNATATLAGYHVEFGEPGHDPNLKVWETEHGMSADMAALTGKTEGAGFHLILNNVRVTDNRIPPRGFNNAAFEAVGAHPIGATFADGQYWDDVVYPLPPGAVGAEVKLYYQTTSKDYIEFLRDEDQGSFGPILHDLWEENGKSEPVLMAQAFVSGETKVVENCRKNLFKLQSKYFKTYLKEWDRCFGTEARGLTCDEARPESKVERRANDLDAKMGGDEDVRCNAENLAPETLGQGSYCPAPCAHIGMFDNAELSDCAACLAVELGDAALTAGYGTAPNLGLPNATPAGEPVRCQRIMTKAIRKLSSDWVSNMVRCEKDNLSGSNTPAKDCITDPDGLTSVDQASAARQLLKCDSFASIPGCATEGTLANVQQCIIDTLGEIVEPFVEVAYP